MSILTKRVQNKRLQALNGSCGRFLFECSELLAESEDFQGGITPVRKKTPNAAKIVSKNWTMHSRL
jgi:hypothetical protein